MVLNSRRVNSLHYRRQQRMSKRPRPAPSTKAKAQAKAKAPPPTIASIAAAADNASKGYVAKHRRAHKKERKTGPFWYGVAIGRTPGVYLTEAEARAETLGVDGYLCREFDHEWAAREFVDTVTSRITSPDAPLQMVYTDGACQGNQIKDEAARAAGVGVYWGRPEHPRNVSRPVHGRRTNQVAELEALLDALIGVAEDRKAHQEALEAFEASGGAASPLAAAVPLPEYIITTDSHYAAECVLSYQHAWRVNGWLTKDMSPVKNLDAVRAACDKFLQVQAYTRIIEVRSHENIPGNTAANDLASAGAVADRAARASEPTVPSE